MTNTVTYKLLANRFYPFVFRFSSFMKHCIYFNVQCFSQEIGDIQQY